MGDGGDGKDSAAHAGERERLHEWSRLRAEYAVGAQLCEWRKPEGTCILDGEPETAATAGGVVEKNGSENANGGGVTAELVICL